jgi:hypothetical protein
LRRFPRRYSRAGAARPPGGSSSCFPFLFILIFCKSAVEPLFQGGAVMGGEFFSLDKQCLASLAINTTGRYWGREMPSFRNFPCKVSA